MQDIENYASYSYCVSHENLDTAMKIEQIMYRILSSKKLSHPRNVRRYKLIYRDAKCNNLSVHVSYGNYIMDVMSRAQNCMITIRSQGFMVWYDGVKLHQTKL